MNPSVYKVYLATQKSPAHHGAFRTSGSHVRTYESSKLTLRNAEALEYSLALRGKRRQFKCLQNPPLDPPPHRVITQPQTRAHFLH